MKRLFLSAPATCALLLGAGLLLRTQAALRSDPERTVDHRSRVLKDSASRPPPPEADEPPAAAQLGRSKQAPGRRATDGELREQKRSHRGNTQTARARAGRRPRRVQGQERNVVMSRRAEGAIQAGEGGRR